MKRANIMLYTRLKQQYELKKMMAAYIGAEQQILKGSSTGMADGMGPQDYYEVSMDMFGNVTSTHEVTVKDQQINKLKEQMADMEEAGRKLLEQENYELLQELHEVYDLAKRQLINLLRSNN